MRFLSALLVLVAIALGGVLAASSCVLDSRDAAEAGGSDAEAGEVFEAGDAGMVADAIELDCGCCARAVLPLLPTCEGNTAFEFPGRACMQVACEASVAYALCTGECYTACACDLPEGFTLIDGGYDLGEPDSSPFDARASDAKIEAGEAGDSSGTRDAGGG